MRKTVTIPAAGTSKAFDITGRSLIIESCDIYQTVNDVPTFDFVPGGNNNPIYPRSTYFNVDATDNIFNQIALHGTAESAGEQVTIYSTNACLAPEININVSQTTKSVAGATFTKSANDAVQSFSDLELTDSNGNLPKRLYIFVAAGGNTKQGINYAFNANPPQGSFADAFKWSNMAYDDGSGVLQRLRTNEPLEIVGIDWIKKFKFIATVAGETPTLIITPEY